MVDITHKSNTLRYAMAEAVLKVSSADTINAINQNLVPKGNVFEMGKAAGLLAIKQTPNVIPDCHPLPIEYSAITYEIKNLEVRISVEVKTIYKTGVEVEAMHGASVTALTLYDMLKPIDKGIEIQNIRLVEKKGGKSQSGVPGNGELKAAVIVCSDSISKGEKEDRAGLAIQELLKGFEVETKNYEVIPDDPETIRQKVEESSEGKIDLLIFTGGTGLSPRDNTPETVSELFDREVPGISEVIRSYGQERMPYAMLSRSIAGVKGEMLILTLPGSTNGAKEGIQAVFPHVLHVFNVIKGARHD